MPYIHIGYVQKLGKLLHTRTYIYIVCMIVIISSRARFTCQKLVTCPPIVRRSVGRSVVPDGQVQKNRSKAPYNNELESIIH